MRCCAGKTRNGAFAIDDASRLADEAGLDLRQTHEMPSNN